MPILDDHGRLFGKLNLIDAAVAFVVLMLIPLVFGAFALFRTPTPQITAVDPSRSEPDVETQVIIQGQDLRPFLRAVIGSQTVTVLFENTERAELLVPPLTTGVYDLVLYDEAQEVARLAGALTVAPEVLPPETHVRVFGGFIGLDSDEAAALAADLASRVGKKMSWGAVLAVQPPEPDYVRLDFNPQTRVPLDGVSRVGGLLRVRCTIVGGRCLVGGVSIAPGEVIPIRDGASADPVRTRSFLVEQVLVPTQLPRISTSEPANVTLGETASVIVQGARFHPFLEAAVGGQPATFVFESPEQSVVELPALRAGVYDLVLYDTGEEVARHPGALTVEFAAAAELMVVGGFTGRELDEARALGERLHNRIGDQAPWGTIVDLRPPTEDWVSLSNGAIAPLEGTYRIGALLRLRCKATGVACRIGDAVIAVGETVPIAIADGTSPERGAAGFLVEQVLGSTQSLQISTSEPATVTLGETASVIVQGARFHPFLEAAVGGQPATFVFESPEQSVVELPALRAGVYDLVLYTEGEQVARLPEALTVETLIEIRLRVVMRPELVKNLEQDRSGRDESPRTNELRPELLSYDILGEFTGDDRLADRLQGRMSVVMVVARVPATRRSDGWYADGQPLLTGRDFEFTLSSYTLRGLLVDVHFTPQISTVASDSIP